MIIDSLLKPLVSLAYKVTKKKEKRLGYSVEFQDLPSTWLKAKAIYEMDGVWKRQGLAAIGTNYFTIGSLVNGVSTRFDPESRYYQSWLGCYIVKFEENRSWSIEDHFNLTVADQKNWLKLYGNIRPNVTLAYESFKQIGQTEISGFMGDLYQGDIYSDSDVGSGKNSIYNKLQIAGLAEYFNKTNPKLGLTGKSLTPKIDSYQNLKPYQNIHLRGYIAILNISGPIKAVVYANAAIYKTPQGAIRDNFSELSEELLQQVRGIKISPI